MNTASAGAWDFKSASVHLYYYYCTFPVVVGHLEPSSLGDLK